jgi:hypothetical protein
MRNIFRSKLLVIVSVLTIIFFILASCAPVEIKKVTTQKTDYYKFTSQKAGLKISVDPYREENRLQEFFGFDLLSRGILPVQVVIENQNAEDGYLLVKEKSALVIKNTDPKNTDTNLGIGGYDSRYLEKAVKAEDTIRLSYALVGIIMLPAWGIAEKRRMDEVAIKRNIEENQFLEKTIYQGGSHSGFLYFQLKRKEDVNNIASFYLSMENIRTKEILPFIITIN